MRLTNDRDQEIIRSAIPNSSVSTTSFISSIGNGEAIAFGEAIAVPMRMKFSRIEQKYLPKANGTSPRGSEDSPDTVDLRSIVGRMRSTGGPNISAFQQSFDAAFEPRQLSAGESDMHSPLFDPAGARSTPVETPLAGAAGETSFEPYRPDMLPGLAAAQPVVPERPALPARPERPEVGSKTAETAHRSPAHSDPSPPPAREPGQSLRESILKKPLSTLYRKD